MIAEIFPNSVDRIGDRLSAVDVGVAVDREPLGIPEQRLRPYRVTQPPTCHRIGLAPPVEEDQSVAQRRIAKKTDVLGAVVEDLAVDLVAEHGDVRVPFKPAN